MLQVAAYCRVSTDKEDQANSFEAQQRYFREYIQRQPDWELQGIYADEGFSGTSTNKRVAFNKMLHAAELGQIDLIVTKEVSRFTRNTVDALQITRELRRRGVGVLFLNDSLDTRTNDGELRLTIMSSFAQDESRRTSERSKWGQMRSMEKGVVFGGSLLDGVASGVIGGVIYLMEQVRRLHRQNKVIYTTVACFLSGILAQLCVAIGFGTNLDRIMIGDIMLFIPGLVIVNGVREFFYADILTGVYRLIEALLIAGAIAVGYAVSLVIGGQIL